MKKSIILNLHLSRVDSTYQIKCYILRLKVKWQYLQLIVTNNYLFEQLSK